LEIQGVIDQLYRLLDYLKEDLHTNSLVN